MDDYRNSPTIQFCADVFPAHRCPSINFQSIVFSSKMTRTHEGKNGENLLISKAYFPPNKMNRYVSEREIAKNSNF